MEFERRSIARTTISKSASLFFDARRGILFLPGPRHHERRFRRRCVSKLICPRRSPIAL